MIQGWLGFGYDLASFWDQTPRTLTLASKAAEAKTLREYNERMSLAYYTATLSRTKRMPRLQSLLAYPRSTQTWQEQLEVCKMWTATMGGTIKPAEVTGL